MDNSAATKPVIAFEEVRIGFAEGEVLRGLTFDVTQSETKVLAGESGTGKTLTLKLAAGLLHPDSGKILVLGRNLAEMTEIELLEFRRQIGFVFQEGALFDSMTVADNVAYRLREDELDEEEIEERVREALRFVEMENALEQVPSELSGGMRRRVSIARALVSRPKIVLYDSPTAGLDPVTSQTIITLILRLRDTQGVTSLLCTHRLQDAFGLANFHFDPHSDRVLPVGNNGAMPGNAAPPTNILVLRQGTVYFQGDQKAMLASQDEYLKRFLVPKDGK
ncbi:MAG TPA: ATP-binding cassette domain-containing protein [Candidatus Dormibacteraeota bacterium]|nr:ATP-binding cassette domain-containing protein [Candidatus Dormibacteraeota bacterium]